MYYVTGNITYSTANNRNNAFDAMQAVLNNYPNVQAVTTEIAAGLNTSGTTGLTISVTVPDAEAEAFREDLRVAWTSAARSNVYIGTAKV